MPRPDATDWLRLCLVPGVPARAQRELLRAFGSPGAVIGASIASVTGVVGHQIACALSTGPDARLLAETLAWLQTEGARLLALGDEAYPAALLQISDPPTLLHALGNVDLLRTPAFAIVGSRNATRQGCADAEALAHALSKAGFPIASGLALGIDKAAHEGGLAGPSSSIAVVGTGLDRVYPAANRELAHRLSCEGLLLSELPLGSPPAAEHFPRRNRLISGLSRGVLVVEAALRSGSLTTAHLALEQGREVFALPGSIHSPLSKGCHWLIKQGAKLAECAEDILAEFGGPSITREPTGAIAIQADECLLAELGHSPATCDAMAARTGRPVHEVSAELLRLEIAGEVERLPGGLFQRLSRDE